MTKNYMFTLKKTDHETYDQFMNKLANNLYRRGFDQYADIATRYEMMKTVNRTGCYLDDLNADYSVVIDDLHNGSYLFQLSRTA